MTRRLAAAFAAVVLAAVAAPAAHADPFTVGIGDQSPSMFSDPLFNGLHIRKARIVVPWDVLSQQWQRDELNDWLVAAKADKVRPMISFGRSRRPDQILRLPTVEHFRHEFRRIHAMYPWVTDYGVWNEANHCSQPTCTHPKLVARYYDALYSVCPTCTLVGPEMLDQANMVPYLTTFQKSVKHMPTVWGLHNYVDANRMRTSGTSAFLAHTQGQVWFTETGGIVHRYRHSSRGRTSVSGFPETPSHAAEATRWVFDNLVPLSGRITRVYLYHWNTEKGARWDSALLSPHGKPRPALKVLENQLQLNLKARQKRAEQASAT